MKTDEINTDELPELVARAKQKDSETLSRLYETTHNTAYFTALGILKNEEDALDAVQESYIAAFSKLDSLEKESSFSGWLKVIVANTCRDMLKRKKPELFSSEEEKDEALDGIPEQQEDFLPQEYIDQAVKRRQVMDIINRLPEAQRTTILLYYYDDLSVKEIAQVMGCGESTVTSRLSYAKKYIKSEVEKLEKRGDKIYAAVPLPFLRRLFLEEAKSHPMAEGPEKAILGNALSAAGVPAESEAPVVPKHGALSKLAGMSAAGKTAAIAAAALVVAAAVILPVMAANSGRTKARPAAVLVSSSSSAVTSVLGAEPAASGQNSSDADSVYSSSSEMSSINAVSESSAPPSSKSQKVSTSSVPPKASSSAKKPSSSSMSAPAVNDGLTDLRKSERKFVGSAPLRAKEGYLTVEISYVDKSGNPINMYSVPDLVMGGTTIYGSLEDAAAHNQFAMAEVGNKVYAQIEASDGASLSWIFTPYDGSKLAGYNSSKAECDLGIESNRDQDSGVYKRAKAVVDYTQSKKNIVTLKYQ